MRLSLPLLLLAALGCAPAPESYPPPLQRQFLAQEPRLVGAEVSMDSAELDAYILSGVSTVGPNTPMRWTAEKVEFRFQLDSLSQNRFFAEFQLPPETFREPVTLTLFVSGKQAGSARFQTPGDQRWELAVARELLEVGKPLLVTLVIDKPYVSPKDGVKLGLLLKRAGFTS